ncbi:MAG: hypothetical protein ACO3J2_08865, partial [Chthoniobacterales bacterium]
MSLLVSASWANAQITSGEWIYTLSPSDEATIVGYSGAGGDVSIPATIDDYPVTALGNGSEIFG